jgi:hypothetical protein
MDIRTLGQRLQDWPNFPPYCFCSTRDIQTVSGYRIHIAKKGEFTVLASFPSIFTAGRALSKMRQLEPEQETETIS